MTQGKKEGWREGYELSWSLARTDGILGRRKGGKGKKANYRASPSAKGRSLHQQGVKGGRKEVTTY